MDLFRKLDVTSAGLPKLLEGEATFVLVPGVKIKPVNKDRVFYFDPPAKQLPNGEESNCTEILSEVDSTVQITSHGIVWHSGRIAYRLPLSQVEGVETSARGFFTKTYVTFVKLRPPKWQCKACTLLNDPCEKKWRKNVSRK